MTENKQINNVCKQCCRVAYSAYTDADWLGQRYSHENYGPGRCLLLFLIEVGGMREGWGPRNGKKAGPKSEFRNQYNTGEQDRNPLFVRNGYGSPKQGSVTP